jgi:hypothetical protein
MDTPASHFVLVGAVTDWNPAMRVLWVGGQCFDIPGALAVEFLAPNVRVTLVGRRPADDSEPWTVTEIRPQPPGP